MGVGVPASYSCTQAPSGVGRIYVGKRLGHAHLCCHKHSLNGRPLLHVDPAVVACSFCVVGPMIIAVIAVYSSGDIGPHAAIHVLHFQKERVAVASFRTQRRQTERTGVRMCFQVTDKRQKSEKIHECCIHPLTEIAGIVPTACSVYPDPVIPAPCVVPVTCRASARKAVSTTLLILVTGQYRQNAFPRVWCDGEWQGFFGAELCPISILGSKFAEIHNGCSAEIEGRVWSDGDWLACPSGGDQL